MNPRYQSRLHALNPHELTQQIDCLQRADMHIITDPCVVPYSKPKAHKDAYLTNSLNTAAHALMEFRDNTSAYRHAKQEKPAPCILVLMHIDHIHFDNYEDATDPKERKELLDAAFEDLFDTLRDEYRPAWNYKVGLDYTQSCHFGLNPILDNADFSVPADKLSEEIWKHVSETAPFIIGRTHPQQLIQYAENWNRWYESEYTRLLAGISTRVDFCKDDTAMLERLRLAIGGMTEAPDPWSPRLTLLKPMHFVFGTLVDDNTLASIKANPENYALIPVVPKLATD